MSPHLVAPSLPYRHASLSQRRLTRLTATAARRPDASTTSPLPGPPVTPGAARRTATHSRCTHFMLGLQVGAAVHQQLHRAPVAFGCSQNKRRSTMLRRRRPARHRTSSHRRSHTDIPSRQRRLTLRPATKARRPDASTTSPLSGPPVTSGVARRTATHSCRTHLMLGLQVGAPVQQQLHNVPVATACGRNKRRRSILRRRRPACHCTSSHHRSPAEGSLGQHRLPNRPATRARRLDASSTSPPTARP